MLARVGLLSSYWFEFCELRASTRKAIRHKGFPPPSLRRALIPCTWAPFRGAGAGRCGTAGHGHDQHPNPFQNTNEIENATNSGYPAPGVDPPDHCSKNPPCAKPPVLCKRSRPPENIRHRLRGFFQDWSSDATYARRASWRCTSDQPSAPPAAPWP